MRAAELEAFLARLYVDADLRKRFLAAPGPIARAAGLDSEACKALEQIDFEGLQLAAQSFERKRLRRHSLEALPRGLWKRLILRLRR